MTTEFDELYQVIAGHHCSGLIVFGGKVIEAPPIVKYMRGWTIAQVRRYCEEKRWRLIRIKDERKSFSVSKP